MGARLLFSTNFIEQLAKLEETHLAKLSPNLASEASCIAMVMGYV